MLFGQQLRAIRRKQKLTQMEVETKSGIPQTTLSRWERDQGEPTASDIIKLAAALGVTVNELLGDPAFEFGDKY